jgi:hypothetical protein
VRSAERLTRNAPLPARNKPAQFGLPQRKKRARSHPALLKSDRAALATGAAGAEM